jgi:hypothetical protein
MSTPEDFDNQQILQRLARSAETQIQEVSVVTSPGTAPATWAIQIKSNSSYNFYQVKVVEIGQAGIEPVETGSELKAVNLAESFLSTGSLAAGTYAVMSKVNGNYIFYAKP